MNNTCFKLTGCVKFVYNINKTLSNVIYSQIKSDDTAFI